MPIKFGPAGMGPVREVEETFAKYKELGLKACEIPFTYQVYIKDKETAEKIKRAAERNDIDLSIHAPYWINLNSKDSEKINGSKKRILDSCRVGSWAGAKRVVFHCGFFEKNGTQKSKISGATKSGTQDFVGKEESYLKIKKAILEMQEEIKKNKWDVELCPEIMGKKNVFGSIEEISRLVEETGCGFCIDFAHVLARYGNYNFDLIKAKFPQKKWQCHFSGIEYGEKGEKNHKKTPKEEWRKVLAGIPKDKAVVIINESPEPIEDSVEGLKLS